jgi:acetyl esterase/lipase
VTRRALTLALATALSLHADTVVLLTGVEHTGKVLSESDDAVVLNPYNSTMKQMVWGLKTIERKMIREVRIDPPDPLREYWFRKCDPKADRKALLTWCQDRKLEVEAVEEALEVLALEPGNAAARSALGANAELILKRSPRHNSAIREATKDWAKLDAAARKAAYERLKSEYGVTLPPWYFDRVARSATLPRGSVEEDRKLTYNTQRASGVYTVWCPKGYDPHRAYPLVLCLHGTWNGLGGIGEGKTFIRHFTYAQTKTWDVVIVSPTADPRPWTAKGDDFVLSVLAEAMLLYNIDMNRVYVIGHSMGGRGTYHFGAKYAEKFAAFAPAASGPGSSDLLAAAQVGTGMYIYHSGDDDVASPEADRAAARKLRDAKADFVYTEWPDQRHGWPQEVIADTFDYFKRHHRMERGKDAPKPCRGVMPSFAQPLWPEEERYFRPPRAPGGRNEVSDLVGEVELGGKVAIAAATRLLELREKSAVGPLANLLHNLSSCDDAREQAARALGAVKSETAGAALVKALADKALRVRIAAARALATAGEARDAVPIASALLALAAEWDKTTEKKWLGDEAWRDWHDLNASIVEALAAIGEPKVWTAVQDVSVRKFLLTDVKSGSSNIDPGPVHRASAVRILKALPAFKEPKLKPLVDEIRLAFDHKDVLAAADEADAAMAK